MGSANRDMSDFLQGPFLSLDRWAGLYQTDKERKGRKKEPPKDSLESGITGNRTTLRNLRKVSLEGSDVEAAGPAAKLLLRFKEEITKNRRRQKRGG